VRAGGIYVDGRALTFADNCCYRPSTEVKVLDPAWSPNGTRVALVIEDTGGTDLWVVRLSDRRAERVTSGPERERDPHWSADGRTISYRTETARHAVAKAP
jgi:Tol biopolymer transport system component